MAEGLRIRHTTLRGPAIVAVRDLTERIPNPRRIPWPGCSVCNLPAPGHEGYKTRHVTIDSDGYGLVSEGVWEGLCHLADKGGFEYANPVPEPPKIHVDFHRGVTWLEHKFVVPILKEQLDGHGSPQ